MTFGLILTAAAAAAAMLREDLHVFLRESGSLLHQFSAGHNVSKEQYKCIETHISFP